MRPLLILAALLFLAPCASAYPIMGDSVAVFPEPSIRTGPGESPIVSEELSTPDSTTQEALAARARQLVGAEVPVPTIRLVQISDPRPLGEDMSSRRAWAITVPGLEVRRLFHAETTRADVTLVLSEDDYRLLLVYTQPQARWVLRQEGVPPTDIERATSGWWTSIGPAPASATQHTVAEVLVYPALRLSAWHNQVT